MGERERECERCLFMLFLSVSFCERKGMGCVRGSVSKKSSVPEYYENVNGSQKGRQKAAEKKWRNMKKGSKPWL